MEQSGLYMRSWHLDLYIYVLASRQSCLLAVAAKPLEKLGIGGLILDHVPVHALEPSCSFDSQSESQSRSVHPKSRGGNELPKEAG